MIGIRDVESTQTAREAALDLSMFFAGRPGVSANIAALRRFIAWSMSREDPCNSDGSNNGGECDLVPSLDAASSLCEGLP